MNLLKDLWGHLKEWNEWKLKDWIKAGILVICSFCPVFLAKSCACLTPEDV